MPKARTHSNRATRRTLGVGLMIAGLTACGDSPTLIEAEPLPHHDVHPISGCPDLIHEACCDPYPLLDCSCSPIDLSGQSQLRSDVYFGEMTFWHDNKFCFEGADGASDAAEGGVAYFLDDPGDCWMHAGGHIQDPDGERSEMFVNTGQSYAEQIKTIFHEGLSMARCHGIMGLSAQTACHQGVHDDIQSENMEEVCYDGHPWPD